MERVPFGDSSSANCLKGVFFGGDESFNKEEGHLKKKPNPYKLIQNSMKNKFFNIDQIVSIFSKCI